jgi:CDGSH-type Zn-finger protein
MKFTFMQDGPVLVQASGEYVVRAGGKDESKPGPFALCRCGQSSSKPFCDGTHRKVGFRAPALEVETQG